MLKSRPAHICLSHGSSVSTNFVPQSTAGVGKLWPTGQNWPIAYFLWPVIRIVLYFIKTEIIIAA